MAEECVTLDEVFARYQAAAQQRVPEEAKNDLKKQEEAVRVTLKKPEQE